MITFAPLVPLQRKLLQKPSMRGFTLVELMIVVGIIAILAAVAMPAYNRYGFRARRSEGQEFLLKVASAQERYFATFNKYAPSVINDLKYTTDFTEHSYYQVAITAPAGMADTSTGYIATAKIVTPGPQTGDKCGNLSIDYQGQKLPLVTNTAANSNGKCW
jgi:type IV pilus assembly protein PilE